MSSYGEVLIACIFLDPADENMTLQQHTPSVALQSLQLIDFEFMSGDTPQQHNLAKWVFPYFAGKCEQ